jgi:exonuclease III
MKMIFVILALLITSSVFGKGLKVTTYNAGLAYTFVPLAKERFPEVVKALKKHDSDVLCLQEVWTKKDRKKLMKALQNEYPHTLFEKVTRKKNQ